MADPRDLGTVAHILAEAIGVPGQRRFRLAILTQGGDSASLWLEKEQLAAMGEAIETVLTNEGYEYVRAPLDDAEPAPAMPLAMDADFRVGQLSMGVDQRRQRLVVVAGDGAPDEEISISIEMDFRRAYELKRQIADVVAAGRPPCPLCGGPIDQSGHVCPRTNGHHAVEK